MVVLELGVCGFILLCVDVYLFGIICSVLMVKIG